ncbi:lipoprotein precursor [Baekduia alba]|uniref:septal ring lytic transglycosylase RlpA family protein n=1 Tax=Baekduia alba TaxID=2997333 RepID=UPI00233FF57D|nr:septal ring lytic transglycosylase RlpA family protein [Baekduia alba]WCB92661.1 lipoprotein precursor [Baekduia alba]
MPKTNLLAAGAALAALVLALPCAAVAADPAPAAPSPGGLSFADPDAPTVFTDGSTLNAPLGQLVGDVVTVSGTVAGTAAGDAVAVQRVDPTVGWATIATAVVGPDGTYSASWKADHAEKTTLRAVSASAATSTTRAVVASGAPIEGRALTLYRRAQVTWYGPGFYGHKTACGLRLRKATLGVANKSLPCGTLVDLYNNGQTVTVPVIDRGPFRRGTSYDLTAATAQAIGVTATATIGAVRSVAPAVAAPVAAAPAAG